MPKKRTSDTVISAKHALTQEELRFCRVYLAFGKKNASEAYRRSHMTQDVNGNWYEGENTKANPTDKQIGKKATNLLARDHIKRYLDELQSPVSDHARGALADQVLFGDESGVLRAAQRILEDEDKFGFRDAVDKWIEIMTELGTAEVVVPFPSHARGYVCCPECNQQFEAEVPIEVTTELKNFFPDRRAADD